MGLGEARRPPPRDPRFSGHRAGEGDLGRSMFWVVGPLSCPSPHSTALGEPTSAGTRPRGLRGLGPAGTPGACIISNGPSAPQGPGHPNPWDPGCAQWRRAACRERQRAARLPGGPWASWGRPHQHLQFRTGGRGQCGGASVELRLGWGVWEYRGVGVGWE